jgi:hypothetical protein
VQRVSGFAATPVRQGNQIMSVHTPKSVCSAIALLAVAANAGGQLVGVHSEIGDAGSFRRSAQVSSSGAGIGGNLGGARPNPGVADFEDCYIINIVDPIIFQAQTSVESEFDTQLWLFGLSTENDDDALGLLGNDEIPGGPPGPSFMPNQSNDGTNVVITEPGCYMMCISAFDNDPLDGDPGSPIFNQRLRQEVSGPDGAGGGNPHRGWFQDIGQGDYLILFQGVDDARGVCEVQRVPATSRAGLGVMLLLLPLAGIVLVRRRVRLRSIT